MSPRKLLVMAVIALGLVVSAASVLNKQQVSTEMPVEQKTVPALAAKLNEVQRLSVSRADEATDIHLGTDGVWRIAQLKDYPADTAKIRQFLYRLSTSVRKERKTANPDLFKRLSLTDNAAVRAQAFTKDADKPIVDILVGKKEVTFGGTYLRDYGENQSWLVSEDVTLHPAALTWVDEVILNVNRARIWKLRIQHKGKPVVEIDRLNPGGDFTLKNIPEGKELSTHYAIYTVATAMENMKLANVVKAKALPAPVTTTVHFLTLDGLEVQVEIAPEGTAVGQHWAKVSARFVPEAILDGEQAKALSNPPEQVQKEAEAINARTSEWIYKLSEFSFKLFVSTMDDLTKKKVSAASAEPKAKR